MTEKQSPKKSDKLNAVLAIVAFVLLIALLFVRKLLPTVQWAWIAITVALLAVLIFGLIQNRKALQTRTAAFGLASFVTILLVFGIVGVINFLGSRYPLKKDLTRTQSNTLSEQTRKIVRENKKDVTATLFGTLDGRERHKTLLDNYASLNPRFEVKYVDVNREPSLAKAAGITQNHTLVLSSSEGQAAPLTSKVVDPTEEKITNALVKMLSSETKRVVCSITGHGERSFADVAGREGFGQLKKALEDQGYSVQETNLIQTGKVPETCGSIVIAGPTKAFFEAETQAISSYLANGGRAVIAFEPNLKGVEHSPELLKVLEPWHIRAKASLVIDPVSRIFGAEATIPVLTTFSREHAISKDFKGDMQVFFAFSRPLEAIPAAPETLKIQWLAQTSAQSWGETDYASLGKGQVSLDSRDQKGPLTSAFSVSGKLKDSKAASDTRIVVFGSAAFGSNEYSRFGVNLDFFANAVSWTLDDDSMISIRSKEDEAARLDLTETQGFIIRFFIYILPLLTFIVGIVVWRRRKRL